MTVSLYFSWPCIGQAGQGRGEKRRGEEIEGNEVSEEEIKTERTERERERGVRGAEGVVKGGISAL